MEMQYNSNFFDDLAVRFSMYLVILMNHALKDSDRRSL